MTQRTFLHNKTGGMYFLDHRTAAAADDIKDGDAVVVYEASDGRLFVRTFKGFFDGRFEEVK